MSWYDLPSPSPPTPGHLQPQPPPLCSNSKAYLHNLCNYVMPTLRLTTDQYWTHSDLVPTPRATIYIPFLHLSYLSRMRRQLSSHFCPGIQQGSIPLE